VQIMRVLVLRLRSLAWVEETCLAHLAAPIVLPPDTLADTLIVLWRRRTAHRTECRYGHGMVVSGAGGWT
jgi:hypothetical protein